MIATGVEYMSVSDLLDRPQAGGELTSGIFRDPLFKHQLKGSDGGLVVETQTRLSGVGGKKTIAATPVADETEAQAYVNAFDRATLHYGRDRGIQTYSFRHDAASNQVVMTNRAENARGDMGPGHDEFRITMLEKDVYGQPKSFEGVKSTDGIVVHEEGRHFETVGALANRAARDHLAHRAEAKTYQQTGHAALPLSHASAIISEFNKRQNADGFGAPSTGRQQSTDKDPIPEHGARFSLAAGRLDIVSDPQDPANASWSYKVRERQRDNTYALVEKESGPLNVASLNGLMAAKAKKPANAQSTEIRADMMRRATFVEDVAALASKKALPAMPDTAEGPAAVPTPAAVAAGNLAGWRKAHAADAKLSADLVTAPQPPRMM